MKTAIEQLAVIDTMPLVKNPELITVQTIKPKIIEAMNWLDGGAGRVDRAVDFTGVEVIGRLTDYGTLIVRDAQHNLWKLRQMAYVMHLRDQGMSPENAQQVCSGYPQIFAV